jgi:hypothetical protein
LTNSNRGNIAFRNRKHVPREWKVDEKSRSEVLQRNEQIKAASSLMGNAGLALAAAGAGRWFFEGLDENALLWLLSGPGVIWIGVKLLTLLEAEI